MCHVLKIVAAEDERIAMRLLRQCLQDLKHEIVAEATSGEGLIDAVRQHRPQMVITDIRLKGMDGLRAVEIFSAIHQAPVIVISASTDQLTFERASACPVQAYLTKPFDFSILAAAIAVVVQRFAETQSLQSEVSCLRRRLGDRAIIEKAKGALMKRAAVDEATAFEKMRSTARNSGQTLGQVARTLLVAEGALSELTSARQTHAS